MYDFDAAVNGALVIKVDRKLDFSLDVEGITKVVEKEKPKCIFLTSPDNPDERTSIMMIVKKSVQRKNITKAMKANFR